MREQIAAMFVGWPKQDVRTSALAFAQDDPAGLTGNQRYHYQAMESLLVGQALYWPSSNRSDRGSAPIRRCVRMMIHVARSSQNPTLVINAASVLGQAGRLRHPVFAEKSWDWQYLGTDDGKPGTKWGFTSQSQPIDRVKTQRGLYMWGLLPVLDKNEMDADVKRSLDLLVGRTVDGRSETYNADLPQVVAVYMGCRK